MRQLAFWAAIMGLVVQLIWAAQAWTAPRQAAIPYGPYVDPRPGYEFITVPVRSSRDRFHPGDQVTLVPGAEEYATRLPRSYVVMDVIDRELVTVDLTGPCQTLRLAPVSAR